MTKILIDEAVVRQAQQVPLHELLAKVPADARLVIQDADGFGTSFIPVGRYCQEAATVIRQALADAALDKMAENAKELGLSYEQSAPAQPLTQDMVESCPYDAETLRGAYFDGWLKAEAAHGITKGGAA